MLKFFREKRKVRIPIISEFDYWMPSFCNGSFDYFFEEINNMLYRKGKVMGREDAEIFYKRTYEYYHPIAKRLVEEQKKS